MLIAPPAAYPLLPLGSKDDVRGGGVGIWFVYCACAAYCDETVFGCGNAAHGCWGCGGGAWYAASGAGAGEGGGRYWPG